MVRRVSRVGALNVMVGVLFHVILDIVLEEGLYHYFITKEEEKALLSRDEQEGRKAIRAKE